MRLARTKTPRRGGFTLIELLVVIGIIALLVALTATGVMKALDKGYEVRCRSEVSQLATSVGNFQTAFSVDTPFPSRIRLREDLTTYNLGNQYEADSLQYLTRLWPRLAGSNRGGKVFVDWNGNGAYDQNPVDLEGDQCLVFFLGGIPQAGGGTLGFAPDQADPSIATGPGVTRKGPYFKFDSGRLFDRSGLGFYSYSDTYMKAPPGQAWTGSPYAYFSSYKGGNGYLRYAGVANSDCNTLNVSPYAEVLGSRFVNPTGFQIISAGADGQFGRGSLTSPPAQAGWPGPNPAPTWSPATAGTTPAMWSLAASPNVRAGYDDISNFHSLLMGIPVQQ
jgi:prepilin-type N-terminal cleavage/methylation domain-containing protein